MALSVTHRRHAKMERLARRRDPTAFRKTRLRGETAFPLADDAGPRAVLQLARMLLDPGVRREKWPIVRVADMGYDVFGQTVVRPVDLDVIVVAFAQPIPCQVDEAVEVQRVEGPKLPKADRFGITVGLWSGGNLGLHGT